METKEASKQIAALIRAIQADTHDAVVAMERSTQGVVEGTRLSDEAGRASERTVRPLALAFHPPAWLLISWCELRSDFRNFRLDRIASCEATAECFTDEPGKSLADYLRRLEQELSDPSAGGRSQSP